jgi:hypothetical protein
MAAATNESSTRRMVRALRRGERLTDEHAGLATLALSTARALDDARARDARTYELAQMARAHLLALEALSAIPEPMVPDALDQWFADLATPGPGTTDAWLDGRLEA